MNRLYVQTASVVVAIVCAVVGMTPKIARADQPRQETAKSSVSLDGRHHAPSFLIDVGLNVGQRVKGDRLAGRVNAKIEAGVKWRTPWRRWDRLALSVGTLLAAQNIRSDPDYHSDSGPPPSNALYVAGHAGRPLNPRWSLWLSGGPTLACSGCKAFRDYGFVASAAFEYKSSISLTVGAKVVAFDLGRARRAFGTEVDLYGGVQLRGRPAYTLALPGLLIGAVLLLLQLPWSN